MIRNLRIVLMSHLIGQASVSSIFYNLQMALNPFVVLE